MVIKKLAGKVARRTSNKKRSTTRKSKSAEISTEEMHFLIEKKAYEIYAGRGYTHGDDLNDWYQAEEMVKKSK